MISVNPKRIKEPELVTKGLQLHKAGDWTEAMDVYAKVLTKHPKHAVVLYLMGLLFESINEQHRALDLLTQAARIKPGFVEAHYNIGVVYQWLGKIEEARAAYERAIRLNPNFAAAYVNLGNALLALGEHEAAIKAYDRASELRPDTTEGLHNRSFVYLLRGQWDQGWQDYEHRWKLPGAFAHNPFPPGVPWWNGEQLHGKRLLVLHEQGAGDTFMMLRYVPLLEARGAKVILRVPDSMYRLVRWNFPDCEVQPQDVSGPNGREPMPWPACDYVIPTMSLPRLFGTMPDSVPCSDAPYLRAPMDGPEIPLVGGLRVGFVWKGSKDHKNDRNRSSPLSKWARLFNIPGVTWYCLQHEISEPERQALRSTRNVQFVAGVKDWADTANVLSKLDAVLGVDTGLLHLAGAMGVPTVAMLAATPDFRWMLHTEKTVWYDTVRLIRQPKLGDWDAVILRAAYWVAKARDILQGQEAA